MRMFGDLAFCLALALTISATSTDTADTFRKLTDAEIKAQVIGMEITDDVHFTDQYMRDGTWVGVSMGRKRVGEWQIKQGQLCIEAQRGEDSQCAEVWVSGAKVQWRVIGDPVPFDVIIQKQQPRG